MIGSYSGLMQTQKFSLDTGAGMNKICRSKFHEGWEDVIDLKDNWRKFSDDNGCLLPLGASIWLTVRFSNSLYLVKFVVAEMLHVQVIISTAFLNRNVLTTLCTQQIIIFRDG